MRLFFAIILLTWLTPVYTNADIPFSTVPPGWKLLVNDQASRAVWFPGDGYLDTYFMIVPGDVRDQYLYSYLPANDMVIVWAGKFEAGGLEWEATIADSHGRHAMVAIARSPRVWTMIVAAPTVEWNQASVGFKHILHNSPSSAADVIPHPLPQDNLTIAGYHIRVTGTTIYKSSAPFIAKWVVDVETAPSSVQVHIQCTDALVSLHNDPVTLAHGESYVFEFGLIGHTSHCTLVMNETIRGHWTMMPVQYLSEYPSTTVSFTVYSDG